MSIAERRPTSLEEELAGLEALESSDEIAKKFGHQLILLHVDQIMNKRYQQPGPLERRYHAYASLHTAVPDEVPDLQKGVAYAAEFFYMAGFGFEEVAPYRGPMGNPPNEEWTVGLEISKFPS